ncbi:glycosyltransferase [Sulfurimonas indica]|uniref:glycosyltransferase n=1 Tax=Sulfurimonas indica TaxID=2508707 RepID=UPI001FE833C8|nr:glycosyltransferase [Sulfurimonas indica]
MTIQKKPVAIICLSPNSGGMELDAISFAKKLDPHVKTILIAKENSFIHKQLGHESLIFETINFSKMFSFSIIFNMRKILHKYDIENIVFFGASELRSLYFSFLGLDINLIIRHSTTKSSPKKDWFHKLIYSNVNYHVSTSKHLEKNVQYIIPFGKNSKSKMIYSSLNFSKPTHTQQTTLTLVHTGRITDGKGQIDAIYACKSLVENNIDFKFYIIGGFEEDYKDKFLDLYNSITYKDKIILVGFTNDVDSYLNAGDIFIFPSYGEGLSLSFREALAKNMICIAYNNTSFPELKELGLDFTLVEDRNINKLAESLLEISKNINNYQNLNNYEIMRDEFSETKELNAYFEIFH